MIAFDIETGPLPDDLLRERVDAFTPPPHPGEFDESAVKIGNLKDEGKIAAKIDAARKAHAKAVADHESTVRIAEAEWWTGVKERAALDPLTGQVLAIGYFSTDTTKIILELNASGKKEPDLLAGFWDCYQRSMTKGRVMVGHNIFGFDLPFLVKRSYLNGVDVPQGLFDWTGRFLEKATFIDTLVRWSAGGKIGGKLDTLAKAMGVGAKPVGQNGEEVHGGMFADLLKTDQAVAEAYLKNDLIMTAKVAERMGVI